MNTEREKFQSLVRRILKEEKEKRDSVKERVPEMDSNGSDKHKKDKNATFAWHENPRERKTKVELLNDLNELVSKKDKSFSCDLDDHGDISIKACDLLCMRITPDWEDHYRIETMTHKDDREWTTGLDFNQVKEYVDTRLTELGKVPTKVEKAYDKSYRNWQDQTKKSDNLPKQEVKVKKVEDTKNKEKDYNQQDVKNEDDYPEKPMKEVKDTKRQEDHKVSKPVTAKKFRKSPTTLVTKQA